MICRDLLRLSRINPSPESLCLARCATLSVLYSPTRPPASAINCSCNLINMAGTPSDDGSAIRPPVAAQGDRSTSHSTPQPNSGFSSFQAINNMNGGQNESGRQSRDVSARGTPQAEPATATKNSSDAPSASNALKTSAQAEFDATGSYGTRSRRTGKERLNYAEDQDADFDFTSAATTTASKKNAASTANAQSTSDAKRAKEPAQSVTTNGAHSSANNQTIAKDPAPGATSVATNPKKRKAAGTATPTNLGSTPPVSASLVATNMRKQMPASVPARETNVLSFSKSRSCLNKKGELVADDGTKLNVNGKRPARIPFPDSRLASCTFAEVGASTPQSSASSNFLTSRMPKANTTSI